jgi:hypothetical protein
MRFHCTCKHTAVPSTFLFPQDRIITQRSALNLRTTLFNVLCTVLTDGGTRFLLGFADFCRTIPGHIPEYSIVCLILNLLFTTSKCNYISSEDQLQRVKEEKFLIAQIFGIS